MMFIWVTCLRMITFSICFFLLLFSSVESQEMVVPEQKRILMSDPSYTQSQLDHFQSEIQDLVVKINGQQTTISSLQSTVNSQQSAITLLNSNVSKQTSMINTQQSTINSLQATVSDQNSTVITLQSKNNAQQSTVSDLNAVVNALQSTVNALQSTVNAQQTTISSQANELSAIRKSRYAGGSFYNHSGAAAEYVCMPPDPIWGQRTYTSRWTAYMYGAEYENTPYFEMSDGNEDVPCAVCEAAGFSTSLMIPGRTECYPGWTRAYYGELASGYYDYPSASQYVCVDLHPQALVGGGNTNDNGKLFYPVKAKCGSLPCPPYKDNKSLSCVVCVK